jgi:outer membrane lipoprotein-sorting protein
MKQFAACWFVLLVLPTPIWSQPISGITSNLLPVEPKLSREEQQLRDILKNWLLTMQSMDNFSATVRQETKNLTTDKVTLMEGRVGLIKREGGKEVPTQAYVDMWLPSEAKLSDDKRSVVQRVIFNNNGLYFYDAESKRILKRELHKDEMNDNLLFRLLNGMDLDEWTAYIDIEPLTLAQAAEFRKGQIAIAIKNFNPPGKPDVSWMPRRLVYTEAGIGSKQVTILLDDLTPNNAKINKEPFTPTMIKGWQEKAILPQPDAPPIGPKKLEDPRKASPNFLPKQ